MSTEFWLISAPAEKTCQQTWERLNQATSLEKLSSNHKFNIPDLKVGTLDVLVGLSDDLGKVDAYAESVCRKVAQSLGNDVLEGARDKLLENLRVNDVSPSQYLQNFNWDLAKYPIKQSLKSIAEIIGKQVSQIEVELKNKMSNYVNLKGNLQSLEKKSGGSLLTRYLGDIVKREHFVLDSEYMVTLLVVVPKALQNDWFAKYERLTDMVVPRSSKVVFEDGEHILCNVTLFRKAADTFRHQCRENKFIVREFQYSEEDIEAGKNEIQKLNTDLRKQYGPLVKWLKINYGECFSAWIHVKALRVFVESVLRYGLPVNFQAMLLQPNRRSIKRLREVLNQLYGHLDNTAVAGGKDQGPTDIPGLNMGGTDYYPYVYYKLQLNHGDIAGAL